MPPPKLVNVESPSITPMESIAALQARINRNMEKMVGPIAPPPEKMTEIGKPIFEFKISLLDGDHLKVS